MGLSTGRERERERMSKRGRERSDTEGRGEEQHMEMRKLEEELWSDLSHPGWPANIQTAGLLQMTEQQLARTEERRHVVVVGGRHCISILRGFMFFSQMSLLCCPRAL